MIIKKRVPGYCSVCGVETILYKHKISSYYPITYECKRCGASSWVRHVAIALCDLLEIPQYALCKVPQLDPGLKVYEAQAKGAIHDALKSLPSYICSEYFTNVEPGFFSRNGVRCEDLQSLSFPDNTFDIIITQAVFEHVRDPDAAWREIYRVLKPGGHHIFTIPYNPDSRTRQRIILDGDRDIFVESKVHHGDGIRDGLVYTDFGYDLPDILERFGLPTTIYGHVEGPPHYISGQVFVSKKI